MTILWSFSYNSFVKSHGKKIGGVKIESIGMDPVISEWCYQHYQ